MTDSEARDEGGEAAPGTEPQQQFSCSSCCCLIVVVSVLGFVLFPIITNHREPANHASCMSNVKAVVISLRMYAADHDERLPASSNWMDLVSSYVLNRDRFRCPTVRRDSQAYGYGLERNLSRGLLPKIVSPTTTPIIFDSALLEGNAAGPFLTALCRPGRHNEGNNVGLVDGHAQYVKDGNLSTLTPAAQTSAR
jgi:prepilin-type processing-associated H-X9-DG protein